MYDQELPSTEGHHQSTMYRTHPSYSYLQTKVFRIRDSTELQQKQYTTNRPSIDVLVGRLLLHRINHLPMPLTKSCSLHPCKQWTVLGRSDSPTIYSPFSVYWWQLSYTLVCSVVCWRTWWSRYTLAGRVDMKFWNTLSICSRFLWPKWMARFNSYWCFDLFSSIMYSSSNDTESILSDENSFACLCKWRMYCVLWWFSWTPHTFRYKRVLTYVLDARNQDIQSVNDMCGRVRVPFSLYLLSYGMFCSS